MDNNLKITFLGAAGGVTGSKHFLEIGDRKILLDCGFFQGRRAESYEANSNLPEILKKTEAVILSHAHADHCASLPLLVKNGYRGPIYTTPATADIARLIMLDAAKIQAGDYKHLKKMGIGSLFVPIYDEQDVEQVRRLFVEVDYHEEKVIFDNISFKFYDAGHILGSAVTLIKTPTKNIVYTGDLGNIDLPIIPDPENILERAEIIISESTYGNRKHLPVSAAYQKIEKIVNQAARDKSRIIVPAFALGRTQELIYILHKLYKDGRIPAIPIYIDSPLSNSITEVFRKYNYDFDLESWQDFLAAGDSPFSANHLNYIKSSADSRALNKLAGPLIIIASSGMLEGGRVLHHLRQDIGNPQTIILLTGFQADHTLGRRLKTGDRIVKIYNEDYEVAAQILKLDELSAHADQTKLRQYISNIDGLKKVFLVHGESRAAKSLAGLIKEDKPELDIFIPKLGETFNL